MINFQIVANERKNSKGIDARIVSDTGAQLCVGRLADCKRVLDETVKLQNGIARFMPTFSSDMLKLELLVPEKLGGNVYYSSISLCYSPNGKDLDGNGNSLCASMHGACLTAAYIAPEAKAVVDENGNIATDQGTFRITVKNSRCTVEKVA